MSEGSEGVPVPEEAKAAKVEFDEYGKIKGVKPAEQKNATPYVDADDLPENQEMRPAQNLASLKERLAKAIPIVDAQKLPPIPQTPKDRAK